MFADRVRGRGRQSQASPVSRMRHNGTILQYSHVLSPYFGSTRASPALNCAASEVSELRHSSINAVSGGPGLFRYDFKLGTSTSLTPPNSLPSTPMNRHTRP